MPRPSAFLREARIRRRAISLWSRGAACSAKRCTRGEKKGKEKPEEGQTEAPGKKLGN